jgi:hypothetical protein
MVKDDVMIFGLSYTFSLEALSRLSTFPDDAFSFRENELSRSCFLGDLLFILTSDYYYYFLTNLSLA